MSVRIFIVYRNARFTSAIAYLYSRFVILKTVVRKDLIQSLPLPRRLLDYLCHKNSLAEQCPIDSDTSSQSQVNFETIF